MEKKEIEDGGGWREKQVCRKKKWGKIMIQPMGTKGRLDYDWPIQIKKKKKNILGEGQKMPSKTLIKNPKCPPFA